MNLGLRVLQLSIVRLLCRRAGPLYRLRLVVFLFFLKLNCFFDAHLEGRFLRINTFQIVVSSLRFRAKLAFGGALLAHGLLFGLFMDRGSCSLLNARLLDPNLLRYLLDLVEALLLEQAAAVVLIQRVQLLVFA